MGFDRPTLEQLSGNARANLTAKLGSELPVTFADILAKTIAGATHGLHGYLEYLSRAMLPDSAEVEILERWASIWGVTRKGETNAEGEVEFTGENGSVVGIVRLQGPSSVYVTTSSGRVQGGTVRLRVRAATPGQVGNIAAAETLTLINPVAGVKKDVRTMAPGITGGTDPETDTALRGRLIQKIRFQPQGGAVHDYKAWAEEIPGVYRAFVYPLMQGPGSVGLTFVTQGPSMIPTVESELFKTVTTEIRARAPITAEVIVFPPIPKPVTVSLRIEPDTTATREAITAELKDLYQREASAGGARRESGRLYLSQIHQSIGAAAQGSRHTLAEPTSDLTAGTGEVHVFGSIGWLMDDVTPNGNRRRRGNR